MAVKQTISYNHGFFFITITCHNWIPLIEKTNSYDAVSNWFNHLKSKGHYIVGYIIMPNHLQALLGYQGDAQNIYGYRRDQYSYTELGIGNATGEFIITG